MPRYTFTGDTPAILSGLIQGVNADLVPAAGNPEVPEGTTLVASPGDTVDTWGLEYPAFLLREDGASPDPAVTPPAPETSAEPPAVDYTVAPAPVQTPSTF